MSGFSEQRQQLRAALVAAGLTPDAATQIANVLGNSAQSLRHAGPVEVDSTPQDLRFVGPEQRKQRFSNLDFREGDPDYRPQRTAQSEERRESQPEPNVIPVVAPQQADAQFRVRAGALTDVAGDGQAARVGVRHAVAGAPPDGLPIPLLDTQANQFVGKAPRAQTGPGDGTARLQIQQTGREVLWNLQLLNRADYDVVTKIEYIEGRGLEVTYERIKAWNERRNRVDTIPVVEQPVVSSMADDEKGLRARRRIIPVFSARDADSNYFNTYRIGKFTGGWALGAAKLVTQVWPVSTLVVSVTNLTRDIADTAEEKYVIFAPSTESQVADEDELDQPSPLISDQPLFDAAGNLIESPADGINAPACVYYAIEIQNAQECTAFHSLDGQTVDQLSGFSASAPSALSYAIDSESATPCLKWRSHEVDVLTGVALQAGGLYFERKKLWVLAEEPLDPLVIPTDPCPPPSPEPESP